MPSLSEAVILILILLLAALVALAMAYRAAREVLDLIKEVQQEHRRSELQLEKTARGIKELMTPAKSLPRIEARPCQEEGYEGWVELKIGPHGDAVRVVMCMDEGDPSAYGLQVLRVLRDNSDPDRAQ